MSAAGQNPRARAFDALLRLYPAAFRAKFGEEMRSVFLERQDEAGKEGPILSAAAFARELVEMPFCALQEQVAQWRKGGFPAMNTQRPAMTIFILSPILTGLVLAVANPRYMLRLFLSVPGCFIATGIVLFIALELLATGPRPPVTIGPKLAAVFLVFFSDLAMILGPALAMVSQFLTETHTGTNEFLRSALSGPNFTVLVILGDAFLAAGIVYFLARKRKPGIGPEPQNR